MTSEQHPSLIDNTAWLAGHAAYRRGDGCPWGNESARQGWIAAHDEKTAAQAGR